MRRQASLSPAILIRYLILAVVAGVMVSPIVLMLMTSLKSTEEVFSNPLALPSTWRLDNYVEAFRVGRFSDYALNSVIVTLVSVAIVVPVGALAGYAVARLRSRWIRIGVLGFFMLGFALPIQGGLVQLFVLVRDLGLSRSLLGLILVYAALGLPLTVLVFSGFFRAIPVDFEEAAMIDGAGRLRILRSIIIPLARPAVVTAIILNAITAWNDYFIALVITTDADLRTLPLGIVSFNDATSYQVNWPLVLSYSSMMALPVIVLYIALQRHVVSGLTAGALHR